MLALLSSKLQARDLRGSLLAVAIIMLWGGLIYYNLTIAINWLSPLTYILVLVQAHLYTGLFISAHDAMHGTLAPGRPRLNYALGFVCALLFAFNWYPKLLQKHHAHHKHVATEADPDYHRGGFLRWLFKFASEYITIWQILAVAVVFNLLYHFVFPLENVLLYWILPSLLATLQLFVFGTYLPHRGQHPTENTHKSRSQPRNHFWAFLSCYFFGYHYEHHDSPATPWWLLWTKKG